jgi:hypothetical protein
MIPQLARQFRTVLIACVIITFGIPEVCGVAHSSELATGSVGGTVKLVWGLQTIPLAGAVVELISISDEGLKYQASTDSTGRYTIAAPTGTYKMLLSWMGGDDCSEIHRASFRLDAGANLVFGFLVMQCPFSEPVITKELIEKADKKHVETRPPNPMNVPVTEQTEKYQEQLIPAEQNRWPEIIVSFGKYDNRPGEIRYFPFHQTLMNPFAIPNPPVPLSLPVTVTVDRYTLRAESVILEKRTMVFKARGQVSVSDGMRTTNAESATLSFARGEPKIGIDH